MENDSVSFRYSRQAGVIFGYLCILLGGGLSLFLFWQGGRAIFDPRFLNDSVGRWESLIRYRSDEWGLAGLESPDLTALNRRKSERNQNRLPGQTASASDSSHQAAQDATHFVNIVGEQTLRPIVILIMIGLLALLVRIAVGFMEIGVRLTRLAVSDAEATQAAIKSLAEAIRHEKS